MVNAGGGAVQDDEDGDFAKGLAPGAGGQGPRRSNSEEGMMANRRQARSNAAIWLVIFTMLFYGCAGAQTTQDRVVTENLLTRAGFQPYKTNMDTPKTQALLDAIPKGQITTFRANGRVYHAYPDERSNTIYVGDAEAYSKYLSMAKGQNVCRRVEAQNSAGFWSCFDEFQKQGGLPGGR
jgi:hypothetical protein